MSENEENCKRRNGASDLLGQAAGTIPDGSWAISLYGGGTVGTSITPNDWNFTVDGIVTAPSSASEGIYRARYGNGNGDTMINGGRGYEFEVVCMTVEISVEETDRDETHYYLSCTATPQGGTAPYDYDWSSSVDGSNVISGQTSQTLVVKIPIGEPGTISVFVTDDSQPLSCTATDSFDVCGMTCDFTAALLLAPTGGPYIYECAAQVSNSTPPYSYECSPEPEQTFENGRIAQFSFDDDEEHSIRLSVRDFLSCEAFKTHKVGGYDFHVSTTPSGTSTGTPNAARDSMTFVVEVEATATDRLLSPPSTVTLEFRRPATSTSTTATATLVPSSNPPRYALSADWDVTTLKGKYHIKVQGHPSSTAVFKIDKRSQIDILANSYVGAPRGSSGEGGQCEHFVGAIYHYLGLELDSSSARNLGNDASVLDPQGHGCITLFQQATDPADHWRHNAINVGNGLIVDQNCDSLAANPPDSDPSIPAGETGLIDKHASNAAHLTRPDHYSAPAVDRNTPEMIALDSE